MPIGPYSQAIAIGDLIFLSGQIALDPQTGAMTGSTVEEQTRRIFREHSRSNIGAVAEPRLPGKNHGVFNGHGIIRRFQ